jgi:phosphate transport system substrate-binding protein
MVILRAAVCAALFLISAMVQTVLAQDVTLTSPDGTVEISGDLLGFDGQFYRVQPLYGELTVDGSGVLCDGPACPNLTDYVARLTFSGSETMGRLLVPALIQAFADRQGYRVTRTQPNTNELVLTLEDAANARFVGVLTILLANTDQGFTDLLANDADIVMAQREMRPRERSDAMLAGLGDMQDARRGRVLALDGLVPVVAQDNPVAKISTPKLAAILTGRITNWSDLGGPDAPITLHLRNESAGIWQVVVDRLLRPAGGTLTEGALRHISDQALGKAVAQDPFGLGLISASAAGANKTLGLTGACGFSLLADRLSLKTEDYPLSAPMFLYLPARRLPKLGRDFIRFTRSDAAQLVIRRAGLTDQAPEEIAIRDQGDRFANAIAQAGPEVGLKALQTMVSDLSDRKRLSLSFRFEAGSARLDAQSRSNVALLAQALEAGQYDARDLLFAGFSDGNGGAAANQRIAAKRADAVLLAVKQAAETANLEQLTLNARGFGEALPMACDDSAWGRQVNRRVEVWVH